MRQIALSFAFASLLLAQSRPQTTKLGHSLHGDTYDVGPRQKPWPMEGIGKTHFPISCNAEAQKWFDQGNSLLHSFWDYEAERAFRWVIKVDPDCAMGYWGLARITDHNNDKARRTAALAEADKRKAKASEREQMYIEAWVERYRDDPENPVPDKKREERFVRRLEDICWKYPDDVEAKALYALTTMWEHRLGGDTVLRQVLAKEPDHPGAHHYIIHDWIGENAQRALPSSGVYGDLAPGIGHAQHMPGHIYSWVGMWREAAISMDKATRVEAAYMRDHMKFPFDTWNYAHNRNYLNYILEELGQPKAAIQGARELLAMPFDPKYNNPKNGNRVGRVALLRAQIRYEMWKDILDENNVEWTDTPADKALKAHALGLAYLATGQIGKAEEQVRAHIALKKDVEKYLEPTYEVQALELKARLQLAKGDTLNGLSTMADAARKESELRQDDNDPPFYANVIYTSLGRAYLDQKSPALAVTAFCKALQSVHNDGFSLAGLVEAYMALGERAKAEQAMSNLLDVWSTAEPGLPWMERAQSYRLDVKPVDASPQKQRSYVSTDLEKYGPLHWAPYQAPKLEVFDVKNKHVTLDDYKGKNVLLIFYLGDECPHCLEQLVQIGKRAADFSRHDTEVLAVSSNSPQHNADSLKVGEVKFRLLSDEKLDNAKRWMSYDDFEDMALHSTILIDKKGRVQWARYGGDPFTDFDFLVDTVQRANARLAAGQ